MYWLKGIKNANTKPVRVYEYISFEPKSSAIGGIDLALVEVEFDTEEEFLVYLKEHQKLTNK
jgi:hypothetical protein